MTDWIWWWWCCVILGSVGLLLHELRHVVSTRNVRRDRHLTPGEWLDATWEVRLAKVLIKKAIRRREVEYEEELERSLAEAEALLAELNAHEPPAVEQNEFQERLDALIANRPPRHVLTDVEGVD